MFTQLKHPEPFVIGLFCGNSKPTSAAEFLRDLINEIEAMEHLPVVYNGHAHTKVSSIVCDSAARPFVKCTPLHSGYCSCERCTQRGVYNGKMTFPETDAELRTDVQFDEMREFSSQR